MWSLDRVAMTKERKTKLAAGTFSESSRPRIRSAMIIYKSIPTSLWQSLTCGKELTGYFTSVESSAKYGRHRWSKININTTFWKS